MANPITRPEKKLLIPSIAAGFQPSPTVDANMILAFGAIESTDWLTEDRYVGFDER